MNTQPSLPNANLNASPLVNNLTKAFCVLTDEQDVSNFMQDLITPEEIQEFARRFEAARLLAQGKTYREVAAATGMSTATVTRISRWLHHGTGGYRAALQGLNLL